METVPKRSQTRRNKRRVRRAHQLLQQEKRGLDSGDENDDDSAPGSSKDRGRSKPPRRRRNSSNSIEEDIIDGFAIFSFKSLGDLEVRCPVSRLIVFTLNPQPHFRPSSPSCSCTIQIISSNQCHTTNNVNREAYMSFIDLTLLYKLNIGLGMGVRRGGGAGGRDLKHWERDFSEHLQVCLLNCCLELCT